MIIYKTTNLINGKIYVGQDRHNNPMYFGSGTLIKNAIKKYGVNNFKKEVLEVCDSYDKMNEREIHWINELKSNDLTIGYNLRKGGYHTDTALIRAYMTQYANTEEVKEQRSKCIKKLFDDKNSVYNTPEYKQKMKDAHSTIEYKKSQSDKQKRIHADPNSIYNNAEYKEKRKAIYNTDKWKDDSKLRIAEFKKTPEGIKWANDSASRVKSPGNMFGAVKVLDVSTDKVYNSITEYKQITGIKGFTYRQQLKDCKIKLIDYKGNEIKCNKKPKTSEALKKYNTASNLINKSKQHTQKNQTPDVRAVLKQKQQERLQTEEGKIWRANLIERMGLENKFRGKMVLYNKTGVLFESVKVFMQEFNCTIQEAGKLALNNELEILKKEKN
jgi:group I intron endonuclease